MKVNKALWLRASILKPDSLESNPGSATFLLYDTGPLLHRVFAFISLPVKWGELILLTSLGCFKD